jgi:hypothetical protein
LRYYFATKLNDGIDDLDLNFEDFLQRVNSDLVGKLVNIASRSAGFITRRFNGQLAEQLGGTGALCRICRRQRLHRTGLRAAGIRAGNARDHGAGRPRQSVY